MIPHCHLPTVLSVNFLNYLVVITGLSSISLSRKLLVLSGNVSLTVYFGYVVCFKLRSRTR
ncbi:hypothetical protein EV363DRAFT_1385194 [Boletus edulis]|nr:hypothetical protein EV363DRAFT_1385194 [Boletus edulis]